ncbi:hypothetical protein PN499_26945 [Kamptonema animale CS-326]|uniref:hypothetical protein n=1 Tax=Kamptonema animale TaxID=92934 RepID=UPI00232E2F0C|nr:hypothetical protein [Kamptonema animale]MDB9514844.1 hypothetical protein [Kamptonema animale CS-326]
MAIIKVLIETNRTVERWYFGGNQIQPNHGFLVANLLRPHSHIHSLFLNINHFE